ncbi:MAG: ABC transporter ATP-binding protein/permease [Lachnospiraceae bacterium]|jgi:ATP-binding cassette subfamily B protein|nr:ABC transporter ATP-binding protein/permease [Lachnospiraceae bacterium]MCH4063134.1 ABC transporter ATP-binding protein/permease [Lachnospiraceae bacterium]MCH4104957.1 ABC transporter ATP-binding protein/permease [Lachnospiraceae bacterium]MCI1308415.1 ABC transporter ATP-binding protein/permease [Lachnospiraceae bacterium]MCI1333187.1 ABC transporter ATP-binding protein/permease [Lachnospiraceae bacterium]
MSRKNKQISGGSAKGNPSLAIILGATRSHPFLSLGILVTVVGAVIASLLPPLVLADLIDRLTARRAVSFALVLAWFGLIALTGVLEAARESLLCIYGQTITHALRSGLCRKLTSLPAGTLTEMDPGALASRFVLDADTVEELFTSGIISMFADACQIISIFAVLFIRNRGLALLLLAVLPLIFLFTRHVQRRTLASQLDNRKALARVTNFVPETIHNIRTIHALGKERYMRRRYNSAILDSFRAIERTNFYDSIYSPVVLVTQAAVVAAVMLLAASGNAGIRSFFGMSVGTSVAVIAYISQIFSPIESIGMEIQTIQEAVAGVQRINEFLRLEERPAALMDGEAAAGHMAKDTKTDGESAGQTPQGADAVGEAAFSVPEESGYLTDKASHGTAIEFRDVSFGYKNGDSVLKNLSFSIPRGGHYTLIGRTGAGKSTIFKLLLGLYTPDSGQVLIFGENANLVPDSSRRALFGCVEQTFHPVPGTVLDQITLRDGRISESQAELAAETVGLAETIRSLPQGFQTECMEALFSHGQWQLLSIARAIASDPEILLLDEITANLDADTEKTVLTALGRASRGRTVLAISHRLYGNADTSAQASDGLQLVRSPL